MVHFLACVQPLSFLLTDWLRYSYCVNFRCIEKWFSYMHVYTYNWIYFPYFSIIVYCKILNLVPCAIQLSSVTQSYPTLCDPMDYSMPGFLCLSPTNRACSDSRPSSRWCHPTILSSVIPFSSCLPSFPASGSFPVSQFFTSGDQSIGASASTSVLPMNIQDWFPLILTSWISLQSKGLTRVFSNTTFQKHQFFGAQLSLWSNSHIHTWLLKRPCLWLDGPLLAK